MRCPVCADPHSRVVETRADPDGRRPRIWRVRQCEDCGATWPTSEVVALPGSHSRVRLPDPLDRLAHLRQERYQVAHAGRD